MGLRVVAEGRLSGEKVRSRFSLKIRIEVLSAEAAAEKRVSKKDEVMEGGKPWSFISHSRCDLKVGIVKVGDAK
jgi:hypothetical protein